MGRIIYSVIGSLDGFIVDAAGGYGWAEPGEDLIADINERMSGVGTYLYGRRMYQEMQVWETDPSAAELSPESANFAAMWKEADKVVFSRTLTSVPTSRTTVRAQFDPADVRRLAAAAPADLTVEGPTLAAHALRAGLVDEVHRYVAPVVVGGGVPLFSPGLELRLDLREQRQYDRGIALLRYAVL